jgi:hypothetical protein
MLSRFSFSERKAALSVQWQSERKRLARWL